MDDDWPISQPFVDANDEDAQWQINDQPGQRHREYLTGWEAKNQAGVKGRLVEVVHGFKGNDEGKPRTLIVFEWRLVPGDNVARIRNVKIIAAFKAIGTRDGVRPGGNLTDWDPVPIDWAPKNPVLSHFSKASETDTASTELGAQAGYQSYLSFSGKRNDGSTQTVERIGYRYITGSPLFVDKNNGTVNGMEWRFAENLQLKSGVQYEVRTAVLLRRTEDDFDKFNVTVVAEANFSRLGHTFGKVCRALKLRPTDGPAGFDPKVLPGSSNGEAGDDDVAARATTRDWRNLDGLNLEEELVKDWGVASADDLPKTEAKPAEGEDASDKK
jgi:hypothetical protein